MGLFLGKSHLWSCEVPTGEREKEIERQRERERDR